MPLAASLCSWCLWGEITFFRGPGFYYSLVKLVLTLGLYLCWVSAADWVNRDAPPSRMKNDIWNPVILVSGLVGLAALWLLPFFVLGMFAFAVCLGGAVGAYAVLRDLRVPAERRLFTVGRLEQFLRRYIK